MSLSVKFILIKIMFLPKCHLAPKGECHMGSNTKNLRILTKIEQMGAFLLNRPKKPFLSLLTVLHFSLFSPITYFGSYFCGVHICESIFTDTMPNQPCGNIWCGFMHFFQEIFPALQLNLVFCPFILAHFAVYKTIHQWLKVNVTTPAN